MSFKTSTVESIYFIRWTVPQAADHVILMRDLERIARAQGKLKAVISVVPQTMAMPDDAFRKAGANSNKQAMEYTERLIAVIEGTGMKYSVMRAAASAMAAMSGTGDRSFADPTVEAALLRCGKLGLPTETVMEKLRLEGIVGP